MPTMTPAEAWQTLLDGNRRFVAGSPAHPNQDIAHRGTLEEAQSPIALIFGCSDSRVASELIFDQGLGDLFVVRTAGHTSDPAVMGSIEFGVDVLRIPLIVVLGHENCGAIKASVEAERSGHMPGGYLRDIIERVLPSLLAARREGNADMDHYLASHVAETTQQLATRSNSLSEAVSEGRLAIVGAKYALSTGKVEVLAASGELD